MPRYDTGGADGDGNGDGGDSTQQKVFIDLPHDTIFQWLWARNLSWWDDLKTLLESHAAMVSTLRETTDKHRATLSALSAPTLGMGTLAGGMPTTLAETDGELDTAAAVAEAQSLVTQGAATTLETTAIEATGEAAATAGPALATEGGVAAATTVAAPETAGTSWLVLGIVTLVVAGVIAAALYELDQQIHTAVNGFIGNLWRGLMPNASPSTTGSPAQTTPTGSGQPTATPVPIITPTPNPRVDQLAKQFPLVSRQIIADMVTAGLTDDEIIARLEVLQYLASKHSSLVVDWRTIVVSYKSAVTGDVLWLDQGNSSYGLTHILSKHMADFRAKYGVTNDAQVVQLISLALAALAQGRGQPWPSPGGNITMRIANFSYNGRKANLIISWDPSTGQIITCYPQT